MVARARAGGNCSLCSARAVSQAGRTSGKRPCSSHGQNQNHGQQQPRKAAANRWPQTKTKSGGSSLCKSSPRKSARLRFAAPPSPAGAARWLLPVVRSAPAPHFALRAAAAPSPRPAAARKISRVAAAGLRWRAHRAAWSARASFCSHRVRRALPRQKHALRAPEKGTRSARRKKARAPRAGKRHALRAPETALPAARRPRAISRPPQFGVLEIASCGPVSERARPEKISALGGEIFSGRSRRSEPRARSGASGARARGKAGTACRILNH